MITLAQYFVLYAALEFAVAGFLTRVEARVVQANIALAKALKAEEHPASSAVEEFTQLSNDFRKSLGKVARGSLAAAMKPENTLHKAVARKAVTRGNTLTRSHAFELHEIPEGGASRDANSPDSTNGTRDVDGNASPTEPQEVQRRWLADEEAQGVRAEGNSMQVKAHLEGHAHEDLGTLTKELAAELSLEEAWHKKTNAAYGWAGRRLANTKTGKLYIHDQDLVSVR